jgi:hypothetical protein
MNYYTDWLLSGGVALMLGCLVAVFWVLTRRTADEG